jgi:hypothetical protein
MKDGGRNSSGQRHEAEKQMPDIPGLDITKGIARFGFNEDVYFKVLQSYVKNTRPLLDLIKGVNADNLDVYAVTIHGVKGSSHGIFAQNAGDEADALESAAIRGDYDFVSANNQKFLDMLLRLLTDIESALLKIGPGQKPIKDKPDEALLINLHAACGSYDIDEIDAVMAAIETCEYTSDDGLAAWLRENLDQGKYRGVKERLSELTENMGV